jgi:hypothetical protein
MMFMEVLHGSYSRVVLVLPTRLGRFERLREFLLRLIPLQELAKGPPHPRLLLRDQRRRMREVAWLRGLVRVVPVLGHAAGDVVRDARDRVVEGSSRSPAWPGWR